MQDGDTPALLASYYGRTETLALLLASKADINAANKVQQFKIFSYLSVIDKELEFFDISFFKLQRFYT
jgi:ankyrin repeat protein